MQSPYIRNALALFVVLAIGVSCAKNTSSRDAQDSPGAVGSDDALEYTRTEGGCAPNSITGTNLGLMSVAGTCDGRPIYDGEGAAGYLRGPRFASLKLPDIKNSNVSLRPSRTSGDSGAIVAGNGTKSLQKILVTAFQLSKGELADFIGRNGSAQVIHPLRRFAVYGFVDGSFAISGDMQEGQPLILAVAKHVGKDGTVELFAAEKQFVYMEKAVNDGVFRWPGGERDSSLDLTTHISVGANTSCFITSGRADCWGTNHTGQLGSGATLGLGLPGMAVAGMASGVSAITTGPSYHTCAIQNGAAKCWGDYSHGELGSGGQAEYARRPQDIPIAAAGVTSISAGNHQTCAVINGSAKCWGSGNNMGQLGAAGLNSSYVPVQVEGLSTGVTAISSGAAHSCAVVRGAAKCWGDGIALGYGSIAPSNVPVNVIGLAVGVTAISASPYLAYTCAVVNGAAKCWGENSRGQLGGALGTGSEVSLEPVQVPGLTSGVTAISAGKLHACAIMNGSAYCWGDNADGAIGSGEVSQAASPPTQITSLGSQVTAIATGSTHTCGVANGVPYCWGRAAEGELGSDTTISPVPLKVPGY